MPIALDLSGVTLFKFREGLSIFLLSLQEVFVPLLVKLLVLFNMGLLALLPLLSLVEDELLVSTVVVLLLELCDPILCHFGFYVFAFTLAGVTMLLQNFAVFIKIKVRSRIQVKRDGYWCLFLRSITSMSLT